MMTLIIVFLHGNSEEGFDDSVLHGNGNYDFNDGTKTSVMCMTIMTIMTIMTAMTTMKTTSQGAVAWDVVFVCRCSTPPSATPFVDQNVKKRISIINRLKPKLPLLA